MSQNGSVKSLRDRIREADDRRHEDVEVAEWGVTLRVYSMTGTERANAMTQYVRPDGELDIKALYPALLVSCVFDPETDEKVFTNEDMGWLNEKNAGILEQVANAAIELSGLRPNAKDEAGKAS